MTPQIRARVLITAGLFAGRKGEVREIDTAARKVRVRADGMPTQETVELDWDQIQVL